jgi:hypothetical protein
MPKQLDLPYDGQFLDDETWAEILAEIADVVVPHVTAKTVTYELELSKSTLSMALKEEERHELKARHLVYLIRKAPNDRLVELVAKIRGLEVQPRRELTPEEQLRRLLLFLDRNPAIKEAALKEAGLKP